MGVERGWNGVMGANNMGWRKIAVESLDYGLGIIHKTDESKDSAAFYGVATTSGSFSMTLMFYPVSEYEAMGDWLRRYGERVSAGRAGPMRVIIPSRNVDRIGTLEGGITFGRDIKTVVNRMTLSFIGSRDPITNPSQSPNVSKFVLPIADRRNTLFFYPGGAQLPGEQGADDIFGADIAYDGDPLLGQDPNGSSIGH